MQFESSNILELGSLVPSLVPRPGNEAISCPVPERAGSGHETESWVVSSPDIQFFARALRPYRKIGSGHFHYEKWGMFTYGGQ